MLTNFILKIENPCSEEWTSMSINENGKFCSHCSKIVLDFTNLTDDEILEIMSQTKGKLCGRFANDQLNRYLTQKTDKNQHRRLNKILAGLLLIGTTKELIANNKAENEIQFIIDSEDINSQDYNLEEVKNSDSLKNIIQGKVIDELTKEPLEFVTIKIKNTKTGVLTDTKGNFKLVIPDSLVTEKITIVLMYVGYERKEFILDKSQLPITDDFLILESKAAILGEFEIISVKKKWWQRKRKSCP